MQSMVKIDGHSRVALFGQVQVQGLSSPKIQS